MESILISGGTGLVGQTITADLLADGYKVKYLSRSPEKVKASIPAFGWDINAQTIDPACLEGTSAIVHLAGAGVTDKRWSADYKAKILQSRTKSTALLHKLLSENEHKVKTVVCASAIGYYGFRDNEVLKTEDAEPADDFLADVTKAWEDAEDRLSELGVRVVKIRIGIVLSTEGGALKELAKPIQWWMGAPLGDGQQNMSWIHIMDLARIFKYAIKNEEMNGAFNATAPKPVTNEKFTREVAKIMKKPLFMPKVPAPVLKLMLGEVADMLIGGAKISSEKLTANGFVFEFPELRPALMNLLGSNSNQ